MAKEALLVIDMLNDFVLEGAPLEVPDTRKVIPAIKREIEDSRRYQARRRRYSNKEEHLLELLRHGA
jgi:nicotinamidase-related amidase